MAKRSPNRRILFGVTDSQSLRLLGTVPEAFASRGWEVHVIASGVTPHRTRQKNLFFHQVRMTRKPSSVSDLVSLIRWLRLIATIRPTMISVGTPKAALLGLLAARIMGVTCRVYTLRGLRLETDTGLRRKILQVAEKLTSSLSTHIHAVSESLKAIYSQQGFASSEKIHLIGQGSSHGVDLGEFCSEKWLEWVPPQPALRSSLLEGRLILTFAGRLARGKGLSTLLKSVETLASTHSEFALLIIGPDDGARLPPHNLTVPVIRTGHVDSIAPYLSITDVLVLPTEREGFPNVVLEASASGVAVITTSATGSVDSVINEETGILVPPGNSGELSRAILRLFSDKNLRSRLGANGRQWVAKNFDQEIVQEQIREKYEEWLAESHA